MDTLEIYRSGKPKKITLLHFDKELTRLCNQYGVERRDIALMAGMSYMNLWRILCGKAQIRRRHLNKIAGKFADFNLIKWLCYFGYQPDRIVDMARKNPHTVYDIFYKVFFPDRVEMDAEKEEAEKEALIKAVSGQPT